MAPESLLQELLRVCLFCANVCTDFQDLAETVDVRPDIRPEQTEVDIAISDRHNPHRFFKVSRKMLAGEEFVKTTLITGGPELCKAFLFEAAISWAKDGHHVYYFAPKQYESMPILFHDRSEPSPDALKLITIIYTPTYEELAGQLTRLHTFQKQCSVLLVEDLEEFAGVSELQAARCCAVLLQVAQTCARIAGHPVHLCAAGNPHGNVCARFFDSRWTIDEWDTEGLIRAQRDDGRRMLDFSRLDDAVLVLTRFLSDESN